MVLSGLAKNQCALIILTKSIHRQRGFEREEERKGRESEKSSRWSSSGKTFLWIQRSINRNTLTS